MMRQLKLPTRGIESARHWVGNGIERFVKRVLTNDIQAARAAGFSVVCVLYGYNHGVDINESKPDLVVDSIDQLTRMFR